MIKFMHKKTIDSASEERSGRLVHKKQCLSWIMNYIWLFTRQKLREGSPGREASTSRGVEMWHHPQWREKCYSPTWPESSLIEAKARRVDMLPKLRRESGKGPVGRGLYITLRSLAFIYKIDMNRI